MGAIAMTERCPECGHQFAEDGGPCEVHAEVRDGGPHGLRIDLEFQCATCTTNLIIEDVGADDGVLQYAPASTLFSRFNGRGHHA